MTPAHSRGAQAAGEMEVGTRTVASLRMRQYSASTREISGLSDEVAVF